MDLATIFSTPQEKGKSYGDYLQVLEKEKKKIQVFQRELPLSLHLVTYAIESCRRQIGSELFPPRVEVRSEHVEEELVSDGAPAFEEFIPLKVNSTTQDADEEQSGDTAGKKSDWLKTVKLWTPLPNEEHNKLSAPTVLSFLPQTRPHQDMAAQSEVSTPPPQTASSTSETRGVIGSSSSGGEEKRSQTHRKSRRCWSQDLHRRFLDALNQLGGTEVATPKRIREIMKEDGLTNDEVKSHLQKYRLHSRRPGQSSQSKASNTQQVVVLGGVWMPAAEYNSAFAATAPAAWNHSSGHRPSGH